MDIVLKRFFAINKEAAENQVSLVLEAYETLRSSRENVVAVLNGQTSAVWTADGKSVDLINALKSKYSAAVLWIDEIQNELYEAAENLALAIKDTEDLDDQQRDRYRKRLETILGPDLTEA